MRSWGSDMRSANVITVRPCSYLLDRTPYKTAKLDTACLVGSFIAVGNVYL